VLFAGALDTRMPSEREPTGHFAIRLLDEASSDSDSEVSYDYPKRIQMATVLQQYAWDISGDSSDEDSCFSDSKIHQKVASLEQDMANIQQEEMKALRSSQSRVDPLQRFLSKDSMMKSRSEQVLQTIRQQHQAAYLRDQAAVQAVEQEMEMMIRAKRVEEEKRKQEEKAERLRQEEEQKRRRAAEEERLQALKKQEERRVQEQKESEEKEKEAYRLVQISEPEATAYRQRQDAVLQEYNRNLKAFCEDASMKDARRGIKKFITLSVQQISATQEQVNKKSNSLLHFLSEQQDLQRKFSLVTLASKMLSQCEVQITRLHSFAFPLGEVSVSIGRKYPEFLNILVGMMHNECPLSVPLVFRPGPKGSKDVKYFTAMRFKIEEREASSVSVENEEEYVGRLQGYIRLYAAILQNDSPAGDFGLSEAWSYVALLLNGIPSSRYSASALDAFLSIAGFRMYTRFRRQFEKLLAYVSVYFLGDLRDSKDPDANAVAARLESYIQSKVYLQPPEGRAMPMRDESSYSRA